MKYFITAFAFFATLPTLSQVTNDSIQPEQLQEVVVTGSNTAVQENLIPYTVSVINRPQLEASSSSDILTILSGDVPSMFVTQRGVLGYGVSKGGSGHIKMRGVGGDRASAVLMMVDGQPQFAGIYSHHVADIYNKEYVQRIEVLRAPGSVLYGSNAMAGVINVITRQPQNDGFHATLTSKYGSYNTWQNALTATAGFGRFSALVSLSYDRTDGNVDNFDFKEIGAYGKVAYTFSDFWKLTADYTITNFKGNDPIYPTLSNPESTDIYHQNVTRGEASIAVSNSYDQSNGCIRVYYSYGNHFIEDPKLFHSLDDRFGILAYQNIKPWSEADATIGFDFNRYTGKIPMSGGTAHTPGALGTFERKYIAEYSPYLTLSQGFLNRLLVISAGMRVSSSNLFGTCVIPQAGIVVNPGHDVTLKGSISMGYRNPSFRELYLYKFANPDLNPEKMINYEVSASKRFSRYFSGDLTVYYSRGKDMIQTVDMNNLNTGRFINKGIEITARSMPLDNLSLRASYSYLHSSLDDLTGAPCHQYFIGASYRPIKSLNIDAALKGISHLFVDSTVDYQNYATLDLKFSYQVFSHINLFVELNNVTNARYVINRGYDMPGFNMMGGFKVTI